MSDERTLTRWAHPYIRARVRYAPDPDSKSFTRLRYHTEDGPLEVYLVLQSRVVDDRTWLQIRVPGRPNGQKGWILREALGPLPHRPHPPPHQPHRRCARRCSTAAAASGRPASASASARPRRRPGSFYIRERLKALGGLYGPWAFGTSAYSVLSDWPGGGVVGIHGTDQPHLIPGRPSHGCVRMPNRKIRQLVKRMPIGTPVRIV